jgi:hypothetical protein
MRTNENSPFDRSAFGNLGFAGLMKPEPTLRVLSLGAIALILSGCAAVGYGVGGAGAARSEVMFSELEKRVQAIEDRICRE